MRQHSRWWASAAAAAALFLSLVLVDAKPAQAHSGLEDVVGTISALVAAQLPANPNLWVAYTPVPTPERCIGGDPACTDTTIDEMTTRFDALAPSCHHSAVFSLLYLRVTELYRTLAATPGFLQQPLLVNHEDAVFADLYFGAYDNWHTGHPQAVPPVWRLAFAAADAKQETGTGDALLGMIAHVKRDLPYALWRISLGLHADHEQINTMLRMAYSSVVDELARRFDPTIIAGDLVPGTGTLVVDAIAIWREQGWQDAMDLVDATDQTQWDAVAQRIERDAWTTGLALYLAARYPLATLTVVRDAYCATHWNT